MKRAYIGLDVHKERIVIGVWLAGELFVHGSSPGDVIRFVTALRKLLAKYDLKKEEVALCYEAGPCGFVLARHLLRMGYCCEVIAPSLIPSKSGDRMKTDKRDAKKLASLYQAGQLTAVHIPEAADEIIRDLCRARTDAVDDRSRSKSRLGAFLLRNGHHYTGRSNWTEKHRRYLRELVLQDPVQKQVLEEYLQTIDLAERRVVGLEDQMRQGLEQWSLRPFVESLQALKGFQLVAAMVVVAELGDLSRFRHPRQLMAYLGLVPSEHSSGGKRRLGGITKTGNSHVRWILVEVAGSYRWAPKVSKELSRRQEGLNGAIKQLSWNAQKRLNKRYVRLRMRRLHENKIKVAIARELAAFIWELDRVLKAQPHRPVPAL